VTRTFGLFGSGEFLPWAEPVDRLLIERSSVAGDRVVILPLASAPEGDDVFDRWAAMGIEHYRRLGADPVVLPIKTREDAMRPEHVDALEGASLVYFSGGNPGYAARVLAASAFWAALSRKIDAGVSFGGCSAGAVMLGEMAPDVQPNLTFEWVAGLRVLPNAFIGAHWNMLDTYRPGLRDDILGMIPPGAMVLGIDEDTAIVGDGAAFTVYGAAGAEIIPPDKRFEAGDTFNLEEMR
jgi:cyanophycinase